jgi:hypothetical protein
MKKTLLLAASTAAAIAHAQPSPTPSPTSPDFCVSSRIGVLSRRAIPGTPNYFFRAFADRNMVSYATNRGSFVNRILDLSSGAEYGLPGPYDPVPAGKNLITVPSNNMSFYDVEEILAGRATTPELYNAGLGGVYQSIGVLSHSATANVDKTVYRITSDMNNSSFVDVEVTETLNTEGSTGAQRTFQFRKITPVRKSCSNVTFKLPMISKNGQEIAGLDENVSPAVTKVWKLEQNGTCTEVLNLGNATGKADFSYDNKKLVFHVTERQADTSGYFISGSTDDLRNVFIYDRDSNSLVPMTRNHDSSSYYPVWRPDDSIVYIDHSPADFGFVVAKNSVATITSSANNCLSCGTSSSANAALLDSALTLGKSWYQICTGTNPNPAAAKLIPLSLEPAQCAKLVDATVKSAQAEQDKAVQDAVAIGGDVQAAKRAHPVPDKTVLSAVCPQGPAVTPIVYDGKEVAQRKCAMCHTSSSRWPLDFNDPSRMSEAKRLEIIRRINLPETDSEKMPRGFTLVPDEKEALIEFITN